MEQLHFVDAMRRGLTEEQKKILEKIHEGIDYVLKAHKEYLGALTEFDRTGVLKVKGQIIYVRKHITADDFPPCY